MVTQQWHTDSNSESNIESDSESDSELGSQLTDESALKNSKDQQALQKLQ